MFNFFKSILDAIYPPGCISCGLLIEETGKKSLCRDCESRINLLQTKFFRSELLKPHFDSAISLAEFDGVWKETIHRFKYEGKTALAKSFAGMMSDEVNAVYDMIVPVPLHNVTLRKRGFNQSALLAKELSIKTGFKADFDTLFKINQTEHQVGLNMADRMANIKGAFQSMPVKKGSRVLLIDDVMTTGATADECAKTLKKAGAATVDVLTLARRL